MTDKDEYKKTIVTYLRQLTQDIDDNKVEVTEISFKNDTREVSTDGVTTAIVATGTSYVTIKLKEQLT